MKCLIDAGWALNASDDLCRCQVRSQHRPKLVGDIGFVAFQGLTMARVTLLDQPLGLVQEKAPIYAEIEPSLSHRHDMCYGLGILMLPLVDERVEVPTISRPAKRARDESRDRYLQNYIHYV